MKKTAIISLLSLFLFLTTTELSAQDSISFSLRREWPLFALPSAGLLTARVLEHRMGGLSPDQISLLGRPQGIDAQMVPVDFSRNSRIASDGLIIAQFSFSMLGYLAQSYKSRQWDIPLIITEGYLWNQSIVDLTKIAVKRPRPYMVYDQSLYDRTSTDGRLSFYSGHTANSAYFSTSLAIWLRSREKVSKGMSWVIALAPPIVMGTLRMSAGKHYFSDVAIGMATGSLIGWTNLRLHKVNMKKVQ